MIDHTGDGGAQAVVEDLLRSMRDEFELSVAVLGASGHYSDAYRQLGARVMELGTNGNRWSMACFVRLILTLRRNRYHLVHTHLFKSNVLGTLAARLVGLPVIVHDHVGVGRARLQYWLGRELSTRAYLTAYRLALRLADRIIVLTPETLRQYALEFSFAIRKISVLPNGVDLRKFVTQPCESDLRSELGLDPTCKVVVMVARLAPEKGWACFLEVAALVGRQLGNEVAFLAVGSGSLEPLIRRQMTTGIGNVHLLGYRTDVASILAQADAFLLTSHQEELPLAVLEAMAAGCPVVSTTTSGPAFILTNGTDGLMSQVGDAKSLAAQIISVIYNRESGAALAKNARITVSERFTLERQANSVAEIYLATAGHELL